MSRSLNGCASVMVVVVLLGVGLLAQDPCTITVQPGESIQAAIDAAPEGAVICLVEGEWSENLTIGKDLTLRTEGPARAVIRGKERDQAVVGINTPGSGEAVRVKVENITILGARGVNQGFGILAESSSFLEIEGSTIAGNDAAGIWLSDTAQAMVTDCTIYGNHTGISFGHAAQAWIANCALSGNYDGIMLWGSGQATITHCTVSENWGTGIWLGDDAQAKITDCTVSENGGTGIRFWASAQATIEGNRISSNGHFGVALDERPCLDRSDAFTGYLIGKGNVIAGPSADDRRAEAAVCPDELAFLMTEEGGELDRRQ